MIGIEQRFTDLSGNELAYFSHPLIYSVYDWTIRISNISIFQGVDPNLYPFLARSIEYYISNNH